MLIHSASQLLTLAGGSQNPVVKFPRGAEKIAVTR